MIISSINWGDDSAEKDPNLLEYFVSTPALTRLVQLQKTFIVGRKGSGKTGLRIRLRRELEAKGYTCIEYSPTYHLISSIINDSSVKNDFGKEIFYQYVWLRTLLKLALIGIGKSSAGTFTSGSLEYARALAKEAGQTNPDLLESVTTIATRLKVKAGTIGELGLAIDSILREQSDIHTYEYHLRELLPTCPRVVFIVDDLDLGWDNSEQSNQLLLGLLSAATYIKSRLQNSHISICIRDDVYRILLRHTTHSDKYRDIESIRWTKEGLEKLLKERIKFNQKQQNAISTLSEDPFALVFPERIGTSLTTSWLFERTLGRPRELLQLCRNYTEANNSEFPDAEILKKAEEQYSSWKIDDLCTEYVFQFPGLKQIFDYWKTAFFRYKYHLSKVEIDEMLFQILDKCSIQEEWFQEIKRDVDVARLLKILYDIGFIGDFIAGGQGGSKIVYSHDEVHTPVFKDVQIHPCFRKAAGTVSRIRKPEDKAEDSPENDETNPPNPTA